MSMSFVNACVCKCITTEGMFSVYLKLVCTCMMISQVHEQVVLSIVHVYISGLATCRGLPEHDLGHG
jgi:hypothetical protein